MPIYLLLIGLSELMNEVQRIMPGRVNAWKMLDTINTMTFDSPCSLYSEQNSEKKKSLFLKHTKKVIPCTFVVLNCF